MKVMAVVVAPAIHASERRHARWGAAGGAFAFAWQEQPAQGASGCSLCLEGAARVRIARTYAVGSGSDAVTTVPPPAGLWTLSLPPRALTLSAIPTRP